MKKPDPLPPQVVKKVSSTLDKSIGELSADTKLQLAQIREQALRKRRYSFKPQLAIAASICVVLLIPWLISHQTAEPISVNEAETYFAVDPEMLETMDMLAAIGELSGV